MNCITLLLIMIIVSNVVADPVKNIICYYDSAAYFRTGTAKLQSTDLELAMEFCTHLIYGYAGINPVTHELRSLNVDLDMFHYNEITLLKTKYPQLKVFLSVGGDRDLDETHPNKYIDLLESNNEAQQNFIDSAMILLKRNGFDGMDLAFELPRNKPRKVHGTIGTYWKSFKKLFTGNFIVDPQSDVHKNQYTQFAQNLKQAFDTINLTLSLTVLPNVNSTWYFDVPKLHPNFEFINLAAFDFLTPERNPEEADYSAPIYHLDEENRLPYFNVEYQINYWLNNRCPPHKLNLGIASYGRTWVMTTDSGLNGVPVVHTTSGPGGPSMLIQKPGLISWPEICLKLSNSNNSTYRGANAPLRKVVDLTQKYGNYAFRPADENGEHGLWVSFDDPDFSGIKTIYAKNRRLGGVALFDLGCDDFRGLCTGEKYPILRSIKYNL